MRKVNTNESTSSTQHDETLINPNGSIISKTFYLFGYPIANSLAPSFHNAVFQSECESKSNSKSKSKSEGQAPSPSTYELYSTSKITSSVIEKIKSPGCGGAAITMPLKGEIIPFLDDVSLESRLTGACNTIVKRRGEDGKIRLMGTNTDHLGIRNSLLAKLQSQYTVPKAAPSRDIKGLQGLRFKPGRYAGAVIGGGATTRSAILALHNLGLNPIFLINRDKTEVERTIEWFDRSEELKELGGVLELIHLENVDDVERYLGGKTISEGRSSGKNGMLNGNGNRNGDAVSIVGEGVRSEGYRIGMMVGAIPAYAPKTPEERKVYSTATHLFTTASLHFPPSLASLSPTTSIPPFTSLAPATMSSKSPTIPSPPTNGNHQSSSYLPNPLLPIFLEMAYIPPQTPLLQISRSLGWDTIEGTNAMIEQGLAQQRMWKLGDTDIEVGSRRGVLDLESEAQGREVIEGLMSLEGKRVGSVEVDRSLMES